MGSEFIPERFLRAFLSAYPDLFPGGGLAAFGVLTDAGGEWPVGFGRRTVKHFGGQPSIGINCASCHVNESREVADRPGVRLIGPPATFDVYTFFGSLAVAMARTTEPEPMLTFLRAYAPERRARIDASAAAIRAAVAADPFTSKGMAADTLHANRGADLDHDDPAVVARTVLGVLYNMRTALHLPEQLPPPVPTLPGPGRTDAFGVLTIGPTVGAHASSTRPRSDSPTTARSCSTRASRGTGRRPPIRHRSPGRRQARSHRISEDALTMARLVGVPGGSSAV